MRQRWSGHEAAEEAQPQAALEQAAAAVPQAPPPPEVPLPEALLATADGARSPAT